MSLDKLPEVRRKGIIFGDAIEKLFAAEPWALRAIHDAAKNKIEDCRGLEPASVRVAECVGAVVGCKELRRGDLLDLDCEVRPYLLAGWRRFVSDPDDQVNC